MENGVFWPKIRPMMREPSPLQQNPTALARQNAIKNKDLSPLRLLPPLLMPYKGRLAVGLACVAAAGGAVLGLGQIFRHVIDAGIGSGNAAALSGGLALMVMLVVILAAASYGRLVLLSGLAEQAVGDLRAKVLRHLLSLDLSWFETQRTGDLLSRFSADTAILQVLIGTSLPIALRNLFLTAGGLTMMALSSPRLSLFVLAMAPVIFLLLAILGPMVRKRGKTLQDKIGLVGAQLAESLTAIREIQSFTRENAQSAAFQSVNNEAISAAWAYVQRRGLLGALVVLAVFSSVATLLWFGGHQVIRGELTGGQLTAFVFYALLVAGSAGTLSEIFADMQRAAGALERIDAVLKTAPRIVSPRTAVTMPGVPETIRFDHVSFAYDSRPDILALNDIDLVLETGRTIALVGPSGAGKSTFFDLLLRFYDPQQGAILLNDTDIRYFAPEAYRALFALVPQDPTLFSTSIADNIRFGTECELSAVQQAARDAGADDFIRALPDGYDTILGERGTRLSGGQAQRLALARALLRDPAILLLDEATAHLDSATEALVQKQLQTARKGRTTFVIAHRLSTVQNADMILVLQNGRLEAKGTHQELLNSSVLYQQLVRSQLKE